MRPASTLVSCNILALAVALALVAFAIPADAHIDGRDYDNTFAKDFIMDAPWRVIDEHTPIPLTIILKDCDVDDIRELHWIRCWDVTSGSTILWNHDFHDEEIGDDAWEDNYWTWITTVTEGHPSLPNSTLLTPANLGYGPLDAIQLKVEIYYRDDIFNYSETRYLRVHVGTGAFPWPEDWYGGDTHYHTMYTNNIAEFGAPIPAVRMAAAAAGIHWLTVTDHSCDLDETGDGDYSYATHKWEYTLQTPSGIQAYYRDNVAHGSSWNAIGADVTDFEGPDLRLYRGVEINLASIDTDSYDKTLHCLFYNPSYIHSPLCGAIGERPVRPQIPDGLDQLTAMDGFAYAAHPLSDLGAEWGGFDFAVNGAMWGDQDIAVSLLYDAFRGIQAFNTRETRESSDQNNPWSDFDSGNLPDNPYPNELLDGITLWDALLRSHVDDDRSKIFLSGGSDAHGDFNYAAYMSLDNYATDNAIGKVQTVAYVPGDYAPGNLPPMDAIMAAFREGRTIFTDGPFIEIGLDRDDDGDWYEAGDLMIGDDGYSGPQGVPLPLKIRWASLAEFGPIVSVKLFAGNASTTTLLHSIDPSTQGEGYGGETMVDLDGHGFDGPYYFRAEVLTDDGDRGHRGYTNPIWILFSDDVGVDGGVPAPEVWLSAGSPNPFNPSTEIRFSLPEPGIVSLAIYDMQGRRVRALIDGDSRPAGAQAVRWDGTNEDGTRLASGLYLVRLEARGDILTRKLLITR